MPCIDGCMNAPTDCPVPAGMRGAVWLRCSPRQFEIKIPYNGMLLNAFRMLGSPFLDQFLQSSSARMTPLLLT